MEIEIRSDRRVRARAVDKNSNGDVELLSAVSVQLNGPNMPFAIPVGVVWDEREGLEISLGHTRIGSSLDPLMRTLEFPMQILTDRYIQIDYSKENEAALVNRADKLSTWIKPGKGRVFGGNDYLISSLKEELEQLYSMILSYNAGRRAFARGIASKLRLLLCRRGQIPLLMVCAAIKDKPLTVYMAGSGDFPIGASTLRTFGVAQSTISGVPDAFLKNPIDLDAWLEFTALIVASDSVNHHDLIAEIGSTVGSHLDPGITLNVRRLKSLRTGQKASLSDALETYVVDIAEAVLLAGATVLT